MSAVRKGSLEPYRFDALTRKVLNADVTFHWIDKDRFWFKRQAATGDCYVQVDAESGEQAVLPNIPAPCSAHSLEIVVSPGGHHAVLCRDHDLWLRTMSGGEERRLTADGIPNFAYGDVDPAYDRQEVVRRRAGQPAPLWGVLWSPDSRFVIALRQDLRPYPARLFVSEYVPPDGDYAHVYLRRLPIARDESAPNSHLALIDVEANTSRSVQIDPQALNDLALHFFLEGVVWWSASRGTLYLIAANRGGSRFALHEIYLATGKTREILNETAAFNVRLNPFDYHHPNVHVTADGTEAIWYSERSHYGHLYLYDTTSGELKHPITQGEWVVFDLLKVDEAQRLLYFTGSDHQGRTHPYYRYLYRVSLDGGDPQRLTPEEADHRFNNLFFRGSLRYPGDGVDLPQPGSSLSPSGRYFIDSYSTVEQAPEYVLRRITGELVSRVLQSDASALYETGWQPPERVVMKAADGVTDLYGVITRPRDFDPKKTYPVIDSMYAGPQTSSAPRSFVDQLAGRAINHLQTFADAGFIVVAIDGRGTAHRSRDFRDAFLGTEDVFGSADHIAALRNLAIERPYMDLERVGVRGESFGGYAALRAMLLLPEFFKVGVAATGPGGYLDAEGQTNVERFFGVPSDSQDARAHYERISNNRLASRLEGRVLLIYGGIDESVPLKQAFTVFDAFVNADKDVDMLVVPNATHGVATEPYVVRRSVQYFIDHLRRHAAPPEEA